MTAQLHVEGPAACRDGHQHQHNSRQKRTLRRASTAAGHKQHPNRRHERGRSRLSAAPAFGRTGYTEIRTSWNWARAGRALPHKRPASSVDRECHRFRLNSAGRFGIGVGSHT